MLFALMENLPDDIIALIWGHFNASNKIFLNKEYYSKYNNLIDKLIPRRYESYIRDIIRNDCSFVFKNLLDRKFIKWILMHNYKYNDVIYTDYIHFILYYSSLNKSHKCNNILNLELRLLGLKKDWRTNSRIKNNRWSY
jgi:hypothetical protein